MKRARVRLKASEGGRAIQAWPRIGRPRDAGWQTPRPGGSKFRAGTCHNAPGEGAWSHAGEPRSEEPIRYRYPVTNLTMIQAIVATRTLPANTSSSKRARCGLFQRANDGGPFRQILRCERSLPCRFIGSNEGKRFVVSSARPAPSSRFEQWPWEMPCPAGARSGPAPCRPADINWTNEAGRALAGSNAALPPPVVIWYGLCRP